jgi:hypothetical protein
MRRQSTRAQHQKLARPERVVQAGRQMGVRAVHDAHATPEVGQNSASGDGRQMELERCTTYRLDRNGRLLHLTQHVLMLCSRRLAHFVGADELDVVGREHPLCGEKAEKKREEDVSGVSTWLGWCEVRKKGRKRRRA